MSFSPRRRSPRVVVTGPAETQQAFHSPQPTSPRVQTHVVYDNPASVPQSPGPAQSAFQPSPMMQPIPTHAPLQANARELLLQSRDVIRKLQLELETERKKRSDAEAQILHLKRDNERLRDNQSSSQHEKSSAHDKTNRYIQEILIAKANEEVNLARIDELEAELEEEGAKADALGDKLATLQTKCHQLELELHDRDNELRHLRGDTDSGAAQPRRLKRSESSEMRLDTMKALETGMQSLTTSIQEEKAALANKLATESQKRERLERRLADQSDDVQSAMRRMLHSIDTFEQKLAADCQVRLQKLSARLSTALQQLYRLTAWSQSHHMNDKDKISSLTRTLEKEQRDHNATKQLVLDMKRNQEEQMNELQQALQQKFEKYGQDASQLRDKVNSVADENSQLREANNKLSTALEAASEKELELSKDLEKALRELTSAYNERAAVLKERENAQSIMQEAQENIKEFREQMRIQQQEVEARVAEQVKDADDKVQLLEEALQELEAEKGRLVSEVTSLKNTLADKETALSALAEEHAKTSQRLELAETGQAELKQALEDTNTALASAIDQKKSADEETTSLKQAMEGSEATIEQLRDVIAQQDQTISELNEDIRAVEANYIDDQGQDEQVERLQEELEHAEASVRDLEEQVRELKARLEEALEHKRQAEQEAIECRARDFQSAAPRFGEEAAWPGHRVLPVFLGESELQPASGPPTFRSPKHARRRGVEPRTPTLPREDVMTSPYKRVRRGEENPPSPLNNSEPTLKRKPSEYELQRIMDARNQQQQVNGRNAEAGQQTDTPPLPGDETLKSQEARKAQRRIEALLRMALEIQARYEKERKLQNKYLRLKSKRSDADKLKAKAKHEKQRRAQLEQQCQSYLSQCNLLEEQIKSQEVKLEQAEHDKHQLQEQLHSQADLGDAKSAKVSTWHKELIQRMEGVIKSMEAQAQQVKLSNQVLDDQLYV